MTLEQFLRGKLSTNFVPLIKKDKCEICNSKDKLHLHHIKPFAIMLEETLVDLDLQYYNKDDYTDIEIKNITNVMLGKHLDSYYLTLCKDCHSQLHKVKDGSLSNITSKHEEFYEKERLRNELNKIYKAKAEQKRIKEVIMPYLNSIIGKKLFKDEQEELINIFKNNGLKARTMGINTLNEILKDRQLSYKIILGKRKSYRNKDNKIKKEKSHWIIQKLPNKINKL